MKAWSVFTDYGDYSSIVFADTAGRARQKAQSTDACEYVDWRDIRVKRMPKLDGMEDREPRDAPWLNEEIRLILVKDYNWACAEPQYSDCDSCSAKEFCHWHDDAEVEVWKR